jgi:hypothetical protein
LDCELIDIGDCENKWDLFLDTFYYYFGEAFPKLKRKIKNKKTNPLWIQNNPDLKIESKAVLDLYKISKYSDQSRREEYLQLLNNHKNKMAKKQTNDNIINNSVNPIRASWSVIINERK